MTVLYRLSFRAARIDAYIWDELSATLPSMIGNTTDANVEETVVPILTMSCHLAIFIFVTTIAKTMLNLVATTNVCAHLLFPFQFFDFVRHHHMATTRPAAPHTHRRTRRMRRTAPHTTYRSAH
jgi:hypothetical protein